MNKALAVVFLVLFFLVTTVVHAQSSREETLLILGDSLTAGYGVTTAERYSAILPTLAERDGVKLRVVNAGISGDTSAGGARRISALLNDDFSIFLLALGGNDGLRALPTGQLAVNLRSILNQVRAAHPQALLILAGMEAPPNLGQAYTASYRAVFQQVAEEFGATLIPFLLSGVAADPDLNQLDGIHPNGRGHAQIAETVWDTIRAALQQRP